jgi:sugar phosphate isomerase/epimerase
VRDAGVRVSSLCRGGMFPAATATGRRASLDDNRRAVDEAATLGTDELVLVCGPPLDLNLDAARAMVEEGVHQLAPYTAQAGVRLGIEPFHPVLMTERSVIVTLAQALDIAVRFDPSRVGVIVDVYHVWWSPDLYRQIALGPGGFVRSDLVPRLVHPSYGASDAVLPLDRIAEIETVPTVPRGVDRRVCLFV